MADDNDRARKAFASFLKTHSLSGRGVSRAAGMSPSAASQFIQGNAHSPKVDTLRNFAMGASKKLGRPVTVAEMVGEKIPPQPETLLPVRSFTGAGDEVVEPVGEDPVDYEPAPPGLEDGEVTEVRGRSMLPAYRDGDRLFHRFLDHDFPSLLGELVVIKLRDGRRFIKVLERGSKRGRYTLVSLNPAFPPIEDQVVVGAARIAWVKKAHK